MRSGYITETSVGQLDGRVAQVARADMARVIGPGGFGMGRRVTSEPIGTVLWGHIRIATPMGAINRMNDIVTRPRRQQNERVMKRRVAEEEISLF